MQNKLEATERTYYLKCRVLVKTKNVKDFERQYTKSMVYLIPEKNDQAGMFFRAWLPEVREEYHEVIAEIPNPVDSPCRLSVHRGPDGVNETHYLFVMSKGVEEIILERKLDGKMINIIVLPESSDEAHDQVRDSGGDFDLISGQETF